MGAKDKKTSVPAKEEFGVKMKMGVKERLLIPQLLPREGNLVSLRLARDISQKTDLSQEDMDEIELKVQEDGSVKWSDKKEEEFGRKNIKFTDSEIGFLKDQIKKLNEKEKISRDAFLLCERIHNLKGREEEDASP